MRYLRLLAASILVPLLVSGCASTGMGDDSDNWCVIGGAIAGGSAGMIADGGVGGAAFGAATGAVLGQLLCVSGDSMMSKDSDGDGVNDDKDKCPGTPKMAHHTVDANGCPSNSDGDAVPDYLDRCPGTPKGVEADKFGCPSDEDGDGVYDYADKCPGTPKGEEVDEKGCPVVVAIITNINFNFDSAKIRANAKGKLDRVADLLKEYDQQDVVVVGHTDSTGPEAYNKGLSERRAVSVKKYLVGAGVSAARLSTAGKGESEPLVSNKSRAGRAVNRRVEFVSE